MNRTRTRLSDGRELLYYDDEAGRDHTEPDRRELPPQEPAAEPRYPAGSESAMDLLINDIEPEQAADALRTARDRA